MFNFCSISSSSSGNCLLVRSDKTNILIDTGISKKRINNELEKLSISLDDIDGILITHEHSDHCKFLKTILKYYPNIKLYINKPTYNIIKTTYDIKFDNIEFIEIGISFSIKDLKITPFEIPHDAILPCGYNIKKGNKTISIATDMGFVTKNVKSYILNSDFVFLESNYETDMLNAGDYPYAIKCRIASNTGHLSNNQCSEFILDLVKNKTTNFMLGHLSPNNNIPDLALKTVQCSLLNNNFNLDNINIEVAKKDCLSTIINIE